MLGVYRVFRGYFVGVRCIINNPFAAKWQAVSSCRGWFIAPAYRNTPIKWRTETRVRWNGYVYLFISEYGRDESAPTPGGVFRGYFVGVLCIINNPFAAKWQAVSSCRGRFIAPTYRNIPTKWRTETRVRWNGYTYTIMWKCVFGEMDMCICLCQNTGAMNRPLRLAECFVVISWVNVGCLRSVSWLFRGCSLHY